MSEALRVASYNLRDFKDDLRAAVRVVRAMGPDLLLVQEAPRGVFCAHRVAGFAESCGLMWSGGNWRASGGTTVLASPGVEVYALDHIALRVPRWQRPRGYAVARIGYAGSQPIRAVSVHLPLDPAEREGHAREILGAVGDGPGLVLGGDLNETSEGQAWRAFAAQLQLRSGAAHTFPSRSPSRRIDAVFTSVDMVLAGAEGSASTAYRPEHLQRADLVAATDHLPVWVDLAVGIAAPHR